MVGRRERRVDVRNTGSASSGRGGVSNSGYARIAKADRDQHFHFGLSPKWVVAMIVFIVIFMVVFMVGARMLTNDKPPGASNGSGSVDRLPPSEASEKTPEPSQVPEGPQGDRPPSLECRGQWVSMNSLYVLPCIGKGRDGLIISADVRAKDPQGAPSGATVWIWLMNVENVNRTRLHLTRDQTTLRSCKIQLADNSRTQTCGPFVVKPPKPGTYTTSILAYHQPSLLPPGWYSPIIAGSQAIANRTWKP